jgi:hypothetical protein
VLDLDPRTVNTFLVVRPLDRRHASAQLRRARLHEAGGHRTVRNRFAFRPFLEPDADASRDVREIVRQASACRAGHTTLAQAQLARQPAAPRSLVAR